MALSASYHERQIKIALRAQRLAFAVDFLVEEFKDKYKMPPDAMEINTKLTRAYADELMRGWQCPIDDVVWFFCTKNYEMVFPGSALIVVAHHNNWEMQCSL